MLMGIAPLRPCLPGKAIRAHTAEKNNTISRISQLEGRLDGLVSQLERSRVLPTDAKSLSPLSSDEDLSFSTIAPSLPTPVCGFASEESLVEFREKMLKYFPFMDLPHDADWLKCHRPFLSKCILSATSQSTSTKLTLGEQIKNELIQRVYINNDPRTVNIDLLLGLLTFIAWGHDNLLHKTAVKIPRFTQLAIGLVFDLRLNKPQQESHTLPGKTWSKTQENTLEEKRAVLGCWMMSSVVSSYLKQIDPLQWTPYMDECLETLAKSPESINDEIFMHQIRLQRVAGEVDDMKHTGKFPLSFYITSFRHRIDIIKCNISPMVLKDRILLSSLYYADMSIYGISLKDKSGTNPQSLGYLYMCLQTTKSAIENFFEIPIIECIGLSFTFFTQLARTILILFKLSTFENEAWDTKFVRKEIDVLQVLDRLLKIIDEAKSMIGSQGDDGFLDRAATIFATVKSWCLSKLEPGDVTVNDMASDATCDFIPDGNCTPEDFVLDDAWLKEYLNL
ncbi:uncharacterized protein N7483_002058 [Penicillium malachiteum]|uniref:uncharacterized protein n=1 Tax=Penicillium malachiteum TaxID=1324776 RepID=UPI002548202E|nr:uncharacterized protein N7483_002058 [Penicillium malachiteum]KAJ5736933.1 hypothetical protein N7483_002058 [Penicillium malachiteum]